MLLLEQFYFLIIAKINILKYKIECKEYNFTSLFYY